jgi:hypothetical protein
MGPALRASARAGIGESCRRALGVSYDLWDMPYPELGRRADDCMADGRVGSAYTPNTGR